MKTVALRLDDSLHARTEAMASALGIPVSTFIREAIETRLTSPASRSQVAAALAGQGHRRQARGAAIATQGATMNDLLLSTVKAAKRSNKTLHQFLSDESITDLVHFFTQTVEPNGEPVQGIDLNGVLVCGNCLTREFRYEENEWTWRTFKSNANHVVSVSWDFGDHSDGDSNPGLICDNVDHDGCGRPVILPDGFEIGWD